MTVALLFRVAGEVGVKLVLAEEAAVRIILGVVVTLDLVGLDDPVVESETLSQIDCLAKL